MAQARPPMALVVEDETDQADLVATLLEEVGFETIEAAGAEEALESLRENAPRVTLLFTDVKLRSEQDGVDLAKVVSREWPWIRILVTSGDAKAGLRDLPKSARFMPKPWRALEVLVEAERLAS
jgi:DNA-binding NtrC family response regulator